MSTSLRELAAELTTMNYGNGVVLDILLFECPNPRCARGHSQGMAFSDAPLHRVARSDGTIIVWQRTAGSTIDDITLSPSFLVYSCDGLHGHVVNGQWVPC